MHDVVREIIQEGGDASPFMADISIEQNAINCVQVAINTYGKLDILSNNAGAFPVMEEIQNYPIEAWTS